MTEPDMATQHSTPDTSIWFRSMTLSQMTKACRHLFPAHYAEVVGVDSLCIQWDMLQPLADAGAFQSFVALSDDGPVGYSAFIVQSDLFRANSRSANVIAIYVDPAHRNQGVYQSLMHMVRSWCELHDVRRIRMHAKPGTKLDAILSTHRHGWQSFENVYEQEIQHG